MFSQRKVVVIGDGSVGSSVAYTLLLGHAVNDLVIIDVNKDKVEGDVLDMADGMSFLSVPKDIKAGEYEDCEDAHIIVITAGANQKPGETRLDLLNKNAAIMSSICDQLKPHLNPKSIVIVVSNPCDIMTYIAAKKLGLPAGQIFGSGTVLDTSRLKTAVSKITDVDPRNVHTFVLGEHGDSEVAIWSATTVGGVSLNDYMVQTSENGESYLKFPDIHASVRDAAYTIIQKKGATFYAVAMAVNRIVQAVLNDEKSVLTVSVYLDEGCNYLAQGVFMSLPCIVGSKGVLKILRLPYTIREQMDLQKSAKAIKEKIDELKL